MIFSHTITNMLENKDTQKALGATVIILIIGFIGWYIVRDISHTNSTKDIDTTIEDGSLESLIESGDAEIVGIPVDVDLNTNSVSKPTLGRTITMPERFTPEAVTILQNNIATLTAQLKENPDSLQAWSDLANQYKIIDDFEGAREIWEYLILVTQNNTVIRISLGNLYHYQLRNFEKSEAVFKEALRVNDKTVEVYVGLHELYRYSYKTGSTLAVDILKEGITAVPENTDIRMLLASYYTKLDMKAEATAVYEEVLMMANSAGNTNLVTIIEAAIQSLK